MKIYKVMFTDKPRRWLRRPFENIPGYYLQVGVSDKMDAQRAVKVAREAEKQQGRTIRVYGVELVNTVDCVDPVLLPELWPMPWRN